MTFPKIDGECDDCTDERTELEDGPEDSECLAFILLERVTHHNTSLGRIEQSGRDTEDRASEDQEPARTLGLVTSGRKESVGNLVALDGHIRPEGTCVESVTQSTLGS